MRRFFALILFIAMLISIAACSAKKDEVPTEQTLPTPVLDPDAFRFTRDNFPILDGSTSLVPLGQGIASALLGETREQAAELIAFNRTTQSFRNLLNGECDLVIAAEPNAVVFEEMGKAGFRYEIETIAKEALVFVVNANNPVDSLTGEQLRGIYSGKITNWSQVGGNDMPIEAFQRNAASGSQVMMEKLVMQGTDMMAAPESHIPGAMGELIDSVKGYDNSANAIGYTVFYYAKDMQMADGLKILRVNDIMPEAATLQDETYPYLNGYYCCIGADKTADTPSRKLYDWLVSEAGQMLLSLEGYVPVFGAGEAEKSGSDIYVNYTDYSPNAGNAAKFTPISGDLSRLTASGDYGKIYPYNGSINYTTWDEVYEYSGGSMMGFFTADGRLLTNPVYSDILSITFADGTDYIWRFTGVDEQNNEHVAFASADGSFVSEDNYISICIVGDYIVAIKSYEDFQYDLYSRDFKRMEAEDMFRVNGEQMIPEQASGSLYKCVGPYDENYNRNEYVFDSDGRLLYESDTYIELDDRGDVHLFDSNYKVSVFYPDGSQYTVNGINCFDYVYHIPGNWSEVGVNGEKLICDADGNVVFRNVEYTTWVSNLRMCGISLLDGSLRYYDSENKLKYDVTGTNLMYTDVGDIFTRETEDGQEFVDMVTGKSVVIPNYSYSYPLTESPENRLLHLSGSDPVTGRWTETLINDQLELVRIPCSSIYTFSDVITNQLYVMASNAYGFSSESRIYTPDLQTQLFRATGNVSVMGGLYLVTSDWAFTCYDAAGNVLFCYPYYGLVA